MCANKYVCLVKCYCNILFVFCFCAYYFDMFNRNRREPFINFWFRFVFEEIFHIDLMCVCAIGSFNGVWSVCVCVKGKLVA